MKAVVQPARTAVFGLGSNLGSREALLRAGVERIETARGVRALARASVYQTAPLGPPQPEYLNTALAIETALTPEALLALAQSVEREMARERREHWGARTLDVDLLWIEGEMVATPTLRVPHPELLSRAFALVPLLEIAPAARDPRTGRPLSDALAALGPGTTRPPFVLSAASTAVRPLAAVDGVQIVTRDLADALAAAAECFGASPSERSSPEWRTGREVCAEGDGFAWLEAVQDTCDADGFAIRRAVIFAIDGAAIRGAIFGRAHARAPGPHGRIDRAASVIEHRPDGAVVVRLVRAAA